MMMMMAAPDGILGRFALEQVEVVHIELMLLAPLDFQSGAFPHALVKTCFGIYVQQTHVEL